MKVIIIAVLCAFAGCAAGGAIAWPGAYAVTSPLLNTIIPGETKTTAYSTTQYINAVPASYSVAAHPHFAYHVPQVQSFAPLQPAGYYSVAAPSYVPNIFYPTASFAPGFGSGISSSPSAPAPTAPAYPQGSPSAPSTPPAGDADSAVIDSAEFNNEQQKQQQSEASTPAPTQPPQPAAPQFPPANFPNFPQFPQGSGQIPSFPQFPQIPQFPGLPQFPPSQYPQGPSQSPPQSSFPGANNDDKGLSDEDTIAVESA